jgi:hypothetical protein
MVATQLARSLEPGHQACQTAYGYSVQGGEKCYTPLGEREERTPFAAHGVSACRKASDAVIIARESARLWMLVGPRFNLRLYDERIAAPGHRGGAQFTMTLMTAGLTSVTVFTRNC